MDIKAFSNLLMEKHGYSIDLAYRVSQIAQGMIDRSPNQEEHICNTILHCPIWCGDISEVEDDYIRKTSENKQSSGTFVLTFSLDTTNINDIKLKSIRLAIYLNYLKFDPYDVSCIRTLAHELGHAINIGFSRDNANHLFISYIGCSKATYRINSENEEVEEISISGDGLCEALNSLHMKDLLLDVFGVETKFSYEIMTEIISRIRDRFALKKEFMLAEETGNLDSLFQAINKKNISMTVTNKTPGQMLSDYCNRMVEIYLMKNRDDYISEAQQLTDNISRIFGLNDAFPPIIIKKLEPPIDCPHDMVRILTMKRSFESYNERAR